MGKKTKLDRIEAANENGQLHLRSPINLHIHGSDIWLTGRFHRWQATAFTGTDLDEVSVRMAIDSTSPDHLTDRFPGDEGDLFAFRSVEVEKANGALYRARGDLVSSTGTHPFELMIEVPDGHNAFFAVSFAAKKSVLGDAWSALVTGLSGGGIDAERRLDPWAGVRDPELAAA